MCVRACLRVQYVICYHYSVVWFTTNHSLFQIEFSTECDLVLPFLIYNILSLP